MREKEILDHYLNELENNTEKEKKLRKKWFKEYWKVERGYIIF